jgi:flap endonuclease-1
MIEKDIKPIYVFDGKSSELKSDTQAKRREIRDEAEQIYKEALAEGDTEKARKFAMRSSKLSPEIIESSKKLLTLMGIPYVEAKGEGEAQAAYLVANGDAYAVASQDYDCLLFGAKRVVRNLAVNSNLGNLEYYELNRVLKELNISREELIDMGILIGTDFCEGLKGVGAKTALKLAHKGQLKEKIAELQKESTHDLDEVRQLFLNHNVNTDYKIKWEKPDQDKLIEFLCFEHGFSQERVSKAADKLKNLNSSQGSLDAWF